MAITPERQKLIDQITKLMAVADGTNHSAEADSFREKAAELMAKHNLSYTDMKTQDDYQIVDEKSGRGTLATYETSLLHALADINGVGLLLYGNDYRFVGRPSDIEAFRYMKEIVYGQRTLAWRAYYPVKWGKHPGAKHLNQWKNGFALGVRSKVRQMMKAADTKTQQWGLVPVDPAKMALKWFDENMQKTTEKKSKAGKYNTDGYKAGASVSLNKGVSGSTGNKLQIAC